MHLFIKSFLLLLMLILSSLLSKNYKKEGHMERKENLKNTIAFSIHLLPVFCGTTVTMLLHPHSTAEFRPVHHGNACFCPAQTREIDILDMDPRNSQTGFPQRLSCRSGYDIGRSGDVAREVLLWVLRRWDIELGMGLSVHSVDPYSVAGDKPRGGRGRGQVSLDGGDGPQHQRKVEVDVIVDLEEILGGEGTERLPPV